MWQIATVETAATINLRCFFFFSVISILGILVNRNNITWWRWRNNKASKWVKWLNDSYLSWQRIIYNGVWHAHSISCVLHACTISVTKTKLVNPKSRDLLSIGTIGRVSKVGDWVNLMNLIILRFMKRTYSLMDPKQKCMWYVQIRSPSKFKSGCSDPIWDALLTHPNSICIQIWK